MVFKYLKQCIMHHISVIPCYVGWRCNCDHVSAEQTHPLSEFIIAQDKISHLTSSTMLMMRNGKSNGNLQLYPHDFEYMNGECMANNSNANFQLQQYAMLNYKPSRLLSCCTFLLFQSSKSSWNMYTALSFSH